MVDNGSIRIVFPREQPTPKGSLYEVAVAVGKNKRQRWLHYGKHIPIPIQYQYKPKYTLRKRFISWMMDVKCPKVTLKEGVQPFEKWLFVDVPTPLANQMLNLPDVFTAREFVKRLL